jgi:hypothetical protein
MKFLLLITAIAALRGQTTIPNGPPLGYVFDGNVREWKDQPPTFRLQPSAHGGRRAVVWVRQVSEGLLIAGEAQGGPPDFARSEGDMLHKDHVEIWVAPEKPPQFPPIGFSANMVEYVVGSVPDCRKVVAEWPSISEDDCRHWLAGVAVHRRRVSRLFVRQYGLSPDIVMEAFATPAWNQIAGRSEDRNKVWSPLRPSGTPLFRAAAIDGGYSFEALLPWASLPPLSSLDLKALRLMVDVFSAHGGAPKDQPFSTSSPARRYGDPSTLNLVSLAAGRQFHITDCQYPLEDRNDGGKIPAIFLPRRYDDILPVIRLFNEGSFIGWPTLGDSPTLSRADYSQKHFSGNATACGPQLAWRDQGGIRRFAIPIDIATLEARPQADGSWLLKSGPYTSWDDSVRIDPCSGCRVVNLSILLLTPHDEPKTLMDFHEIAGNEFNLPDDRKVWDMELHLSPDWGQVTIYREKGQDDQTHWESETLCRRGFEYQQCGKNLKSDPPSRHELKPIQ